MSKNKYYILKSETQVYIIDRADGGNYHVILKKGTILYCKPTVTVNLNTGFQFVATTNDNLTGFTISSDLLLETDANATYFHPIKGQRSIFDDTVSYIITTFRDRMIHNNLIALSHMEKQQNKTVSPELEDYIKLFKHTPITYGKLSGFYKDGYIVFKGVGNKIGYEKNDYKGDIRAFFDPLVIERQCKFKIVNYINSAKMFKFTELKKSLVGQTLSGCDLELDGEVKSSEGKYNTIKIILTDGRKSRFLLSDIEIIYPDIKSFNAPKDRTMKAGIMVKVADNRKVNIPKNTEVKLLEIKKVGAKQYAIVDYNSTKIYTKIKSLRVC